MTILARTRSIFYKPVNILRDLRAPTGDLTTPEGRARERRRRATLSALMSMVAKLISVSTALLTVPITLHYLGTERYGMWMILSSLIAMLSFADLGIGNGILNAVAAGHGRGDTTEIRNAVSSGFAILTLISVGLLGIVFIVYPLVPWQDLFNVSSPLAVAEARPAMGVFLICFAIAIPVNVVQRVEIGMQQGFLNSCWQCVGSILTLVLVLTAIWLEAGLPWLVLALLGGALIANTSNSIVFFGFMRRDIAPRFRAVSRAAATGVMHTGLLFLVLQITTALIFNADSIIISHILSPTMVPQYSVPDRLFSLVAVALSMSLAPLWPAYREAMACGDVDWMKGMLKRSIRLAIMVSAALAFPLAILAPWIIHWWVGDAIRAPATLIAGFAVWKVLEACGYALGMFLNGAHVIRQQVATAVTTAIVTIILEIVLVRSFGIAGAIWGKLIAFGCCTLIPYAFLLPRLLERLGSKTPQASTPS